MINRLLIIIFTVFLAGCATYDTYQYDNIDKNNKTILINGSRKDFDGYLGDINQAFRQAGWKVFVMQQHTTHVDKALRGDQSLDMTASYKARYRLDYSWNYSPSLAAGAHICWKAVEYSFSIVDYHTGQEVYSISGVSCASSVVTKIKLWLASKESGN